MSTKDKIASLEKQVAVLRRENDRFRDRLLDLEVLDASARGEVLLITKSGWHRTMAFPKPEPYGLLVFNSVYKRTEDFDPFGRSVYREA